MLRLKKIVCIIEKDVIPKTVDGKFFLELPPRDKRVIASKYQTKVMSRKKAKVIAKEVVQMPVNTHFSAFLIIPLQSSDAGYVFIGFEREVPRLLYDSMNFCNLIRKKKYFPEALLSGLRGTC